MYKTSERDPLDLEKKLQGDLPLLQRVGAPVYCNRQLPLALISETGTSLLSLLGDVGGFEGVDVSNL